MSQGRYGSDDRDLQVIRAQCRRLAEPGQGCFCLAFGQRLPPLVQRTASLGYYTIALNLCRDHMKRERQHQHDQTFQLDDARHKVVDPIEERLDDRMRCEAALEILRGMPDKYREPLFLKDVQLMDYNQMARVTGLSVGLLKIRVMRARRKLADAMRRRGLALEPERTEAEKEIES